MMMHSAALSQDTSHGVAGERGELVRMSSKDTPGSPDASELGSPRSAPNFDLLNMVVSYKRMALFLEPITDAVELSRFLLGWRMPLCSLLVCILLNVFFFTVSEVGWFSVCVLGVSAPAALGYLQDRCGGRASDTELQRRRHHAVHRRDLQTVHLTKQEAMLEVKDLLKQLDDMLSSACLSAESVYKVLYWDSHSKSSRFYGGMLIVVCLLYTAPMGWVLAGLNSALFFWNRDFCRVLLDLRKLIHQDPDDDSEGETWMEQDHHGSLLDRTPTPTSLEDLSPGSVEEAEEAEPDDEFKDAIEEHSVSLPVACPVLAQLADHGPIAGGAAALWESSGLTLAASGCKKPRWRRPKCQTRGFKMGDHDPMGDVTETPLVLVEDDDVSLGAPDFDTVSENGLLSRNEPIRSKVSKLTEKLRKRYPTASTGNCSSCSAVFSVLKKRRNCSNCGNIFCSRCCSFKVLRSSMGATAPEAQRETVFVCAACNSTLNKLQ